jgi:Cu(I)/Ag(I) efflux system membrane fusion protein
MHARTPLAAAIAVALALGIAGGWGLARWHAARTADRGTTDTAVSTDKAAGAAPAATPSGERKVLYWYDPMYPTQKFDKPGKSPFMDMDLVPRYADEEAGASGGLAVSPDAVQSLGLRLAAVERRTLGSAVQAAGTVQLNERDIAIVQARTGGLVERVYARAPGDVVGAGAPIADLLNLEWLGAQQEFLEVRATGDEALARAARQRLVLLGMPDAMIERVERTGRPAALQRVSAPIGGLITELGVRQGMTIAPGTTLARINGLSTVWLEAAVPEAQAGAIQPGMRASARFAAFPGETIAGRVGAVLPEANRDTRTLRVRIELPNPMMRLKAGLFAQVTLPGTAREALVVPAEAVIRTGRRALAYLSDGPGQFHPVEIDVGEEIDDWIVVRSGLEAGQQVVASSQFLIDSEASLRGVLERAPVPAAPAAPAAPAQSSSADPHAGHAGHTSHAAGPSGTGSAPGAGSADTTGQGGHADHAGHANHGAQGAAPGARP